MTLDIPPGDFAGYIFDLDGTLIDTMPLHFRAWDAAIRSAGLEESLSEELFYSLGGVPTLHVAELIGAHYGLKLDPLVVFHEKEKLFVELQAAAEAALIEPVVAFARRMAPTHPLAVATGGTRDIAERSLELAGLRPLFKAVVTVDDVRHGKPAPDMFLLAAERIGVDPKDCLVFEDAEPGIQGALAAGMKVVRVTSRVV
jgi:beta-phosphoglucomutase family hydrolase